MFFVLLTLSAAVLPGKVLVKSKWILFGKRIFEQKEGWERISAEEKHAHQERLRECWATIEAGGKYQIMGYFWRDDVSKL